MEGGGSGPEVLLFGDGACAGEDPAHRDRRAVVLDDVRNVRRLAEQRPGVVPQTQPLVEIGGRHRFERGRQRAPVACWLARVAWLQARGAVVLKQAVLQKPPRSLGRTAATLNPWLAELERRGYIRQAEKAWEVRSV